MFDRRCLKVNFSFAKFVLYFLQPGSDCVIGFSPAMLKVDGNFGIGDGCDGGWLCFGDV